MRHKVRCAAILLCLPLLPLTTCHLKVSPPAGRIVFQSAPMTVDPDIFIMRENGFGKENLTKNISTVHRAPVLSPQGDKILLISDLGGVTEQAYIMNLDGSDLRSVSAPGIGVNSARWSPDGERVVMDGNSSGAWDIYTCRADGSGFARLFETHVAQATDPVWSPNGDSIAFVTDASGNNRIAVTSAAGGSYTDILENLPQVNANNNTAPRWSPTGRSIAFVSTEQPSQYSDIYVVGSNGSGLVNITQTTTVYEDAPRWSPDGKKIAFDSRLTSSGNNRIRIVAADDGRTLDNGADYGGNESSFAWSPDGKKIVYSTNRDNNFEIYIMDSDRNNPVRMTYSQAADLNPCWGR